MLRDCPTPITCHSSHITCYMSYLVYFFLSFFLHCGWASWLRVCYPRGLPCKYFFFFNLGFWWFFYDTLPNLGGLIWCSAILFWYLILKYPIHFSISYSLPQFHDKLVVLLFAHILGGCVKGLWWLMEEVKGKIWKYRGLGYLYQYYGE